MKTIRIPRSKGRGFDSSDSGIFSEFDSPTEIRTADVATSCSIIINNNNNNNYDDDDDEKLSASFLSYWFKERNISGDLILSVARSTSLASDVDFPCHWFVAAPQSATLASKRPTTTTPVKVFVDGVDGRDLQHFVDFLYGIPLPSDLDLKGLWRLRELAKTLNVPRLTERCAAWTRRYAPSLRIWEELGRAVVERDERATEELTRELKTRPSLFRMETEWLVGVPHEALELALLQETLPVDEESLLLFVKRFFEAKKKMGFDEEHLVRKREIIRRLRFETMSPSFFYGNVVPSGLMSTQELAEAARRGVEAPEPARGLPRFVIVEAQKSGPFSVGYFPEETVGDLKERILDCMGAWPSSKRDCRLLDWETRAEPDQSWRCEEALSPNAVLSLVRTLEVGIMDERYGTTRLVEIEDDRSIGEIADREGIDIEDRLLLKNGKYVLFTETKIGDAGLEAGDVVRLIEGDRAGPRKTESRWGSKKGFASSSGSWPDSVADEKIEEISGDLPEWFVDDPDDPLGGFDSDTLYGGDVWSTSLSSSVVGSNGERFDDPFRGGWKSVVEAEERKKSSPPQQESFPLRRCNGESNVSSARFDDDKMLPRDEKTDKKADGVGFDQDPLTLTSVLDLLESFSIYDDEAVLQARHSSDCLAGKDKQRFTKKAELESCKGVADPGASSGEATKRYQMFPDSSSANRVTESNEQDDRVASKWTTMCVPTLRGQDLYREKKDSPSNLSFDAVPGSLNGKEKRKDNLTTSLSESERDEKNFQTNSDVTKLGTDSSLGNQGEISQPLIFTTASNTIICDVKSSISDSGSNTIEDTLILTKFDFQNLNAIGDSFTTPKPEAQGSNEFSDISKSIEQLKDYIKIEGKIHENLQQTRTEGKIHENLQQTVTNFAQEQNSEVDLIFASPETSDVESFKSLSSLNDFASKESDISRDLSKLSESSQSEIEKSSFLRNTSSEGEISAEVAQKSNSNFKPGKLSKWQRKRAKKEEKKRKTIEVFEKRERKEIANATNDLDVTSSEVALLKATLPGMKIENDESMKAMTSIERQMETKSSREILIEFDPFERMPFEGTSVDKERLKALSDGKPEELNISQDVEKSTQENLQNLQKERQIEDQLSDSNLATSMADSHPLQAKADGKIFLKSILSEAKALAMKSKERATNEEPMESSLPNIANSNNAIPLASQMMGNCFFSSQSPLPHSQIQPYVQFPTMVPLQTAWQMAAAAQMIAYNSAFAMARSSMQMPPGIAYSNSIQYPFCGPLGVVPASALPSAPPMANVQLSPPTLGSGTPLPSVQPLFNVQTASSVPTVPLVKFLATVSSAQALPLSSAVSAVPPVPLDKSLATLSAAQPVPFSSAVLVDKSTSVTFTSAKTVLSASDVPLHKTLASYSSTQPPQAVSALLSGAPVPVVKSIAPNITAQAVLSTSALLSGAPVPLVKSIAPNITAQTVLSTSALLSGAPVPLVKSIAPNTTAQTVLSTSALLASMSVPLKKTLVPNSTAQRLQSVSVLSTGAPDPLVKAHSSITTIPSLIPATKFKNETVACDSSKSETELKMRKLFYGEKK